MTLSISGRITGLIASGCFYVFGSAYLIAPYVSWNLDSATMAAAVATWPVAVVVLAKFGLGWPVMFHCMNGVRHLIWDTGSMITNRRVQQSGWAVVAASTLATLALVLV